MIEIIPAVMPKNWHDLEEAAGRVAKFVSTIQMDVMDGKFVESRSWPYIKRPDEYFEKILNEEIGLPHWEDVNYEVDLMIDSPEEEIDQWISAGVSRLVVHIESTKNFQDIITNINSRFVHTEDNPNREIELGIALSLDTPVTDITGYLEDVDFVQFMGIAHIGYQGEPFDERAVDRIREFHNAHPEVIISVDGGVNFDTVGTLAEAGAKRLVSGSTILTSDNPAEAIKHLKKLAEHGLQE